MKYQFSIQNDRVKYLLNELSNQISIVSQDDMWTKVEITIENSSDVLKKHVLKYGWEEVADRIGGFDTLYKHAFNNDYPHDHQSRWWR